jgi:hypothetical protein
MKKKLVIPEYAKSNTGRVYHRGFAPVDARLARYARFSRSCYNCDSYYQASGDGDEVCQDPEVTQYDMVITENNIFCSRWKPPKRKEQMSVKSIFKNQKLRG